MKPMEVEILVAEVGADSRADDQLFHILYDGTVIDEDRFSVLGGEAEAIAERLERRLRAAAATSTARCGAAVPALAGPDRTLRRRRPRGRVLSRVQRPPRVPPPRRRSSCEQPCSGRTGRASDRRRVAPHPAV